MTSQRPSSKVAAAVVKRHVKGVGLDASQFAGHSRRSGLATPAAMAGLLSVTFRYRIVPCDELLETEHSIMSDDCRFQAGRAVVTKSRGTVHGRRQRSREAVETAA